MDYGVGFGLGLGLGLGMDSMYTDYRNEHGKITEYTK